MKYVLLLVSALLFSFITFTEVDWIEAGSGETLPVAFEIENPGGKLGFVNALGELETKKHPFFEPLGTNGRACVTCHQPKNGMSLSVETLNERWEQTQGKDPVFAAIDGSDNPKLPQHLRESHSLLLNRGLFRVALPWPVKEDQGLPVEPEFTIEVVSDPTGVNLDPDLGLYSSNPKISVYRRPRPVANMTYVMSPDPRFNIKTGILAATDPETGKTVGMNMLADSRFYTQKEQALDAYFGHMEGVNGLTPEELNQLVDFENNLFMAQSHDRWGNPLVVNGKPEGLGPLAMKNSPVHILGNRSESPIFHYFNEWLTDSEQTKDLTEEQKEFRRSVARGNDIFMFREFWIRDVTHINSIGLANPIRRSCSTCHNGQMTGMDIAPGWVDLGTTNYPTWTDNVMAMEESELPVFKCTCKEDAPAHPYLGRVIYTTDPGRALATGKCTDIGAITMQQFRGLSARAPYFVNGSAATLLELVDYYDRRFDMKLKEQEKTDLVNFLSVL
ncbi:hypothetical protein [Jiulongibacter sediminis]|uniref:hypothetical protein n=1 Tax=Jiulongibacter sediminis TaxID=1605367 RepID=UPI0006DC20B7|nr:hypothetical protein [Jiulongibacter sediminis]